MARKLELAEVKKPKQDGLPGVTISDRRIAGHLPRVTRLMTTNKTDPIAGDWPRDPVNGRLLCAPDHPMPKDAKGQWSHTNAHEYGDGCFDGCCADYLCDDCGEKWRAELPQ
jgi:hypothetical protein